jgi:uncharacterized membrane protein
MTFEEWIELAGKVLDGVGVAVLIGGIAAVTVVAAYRARRKPEALSYQGYRQGVGRAILLGLEILVAADIIRSVAVTPTFTSIGVLGLIVVIRTVLSFSLEVELEGCWPWQRGRRGDVAA